MTEYTTYEITVRGKVQGVGFRPFIYSLAQSLDIKGHVSNNSNSVLIIAQAPTEKLDQFIGDIKRKKPPASFILELTYETIPEKIRYEDFQIVKSSSLSEKGIPITADLATCEECFHELFDPSDRRYLYPFINCTNCGPRYSIVKDIPYDRPYTSMASFEMCRECSREYDDPLDRRFHAQPIACWKCGPRLELLDKKFEPVELGDPIAKTISYLKQGYIVALKGIGGYHLMADPMNESALESLRLKKKRDEKPFALLCYGLSECEELCEIPSQEHRRQLLSTERPIVLLPKRENQPLPEKVAPQNTHYGLMLPYTPLHFLLMKDSFKYLICTSANISDNPIIHNEKSVDFKELSRISDFVLTHDRAIINFSDDSLVKCVGDTQGTVTQTIRNSRGFVPDLFEFKKKGPPLIAVGAELKNTISLTKGQEIFLSQHVGDLKGVGLYKCFVELIENMQTFFDHKAEAVVCDLHPNFMSTAYAEKLGIQLIRCQHHHAHMNACMAENGIESPAIGVVFDGMGYGLDGHIWGGEFLTGDYKTFQRKAHFSYFPLPGGDKCNKEIYRSAYGLLASHFEHTSVSLPSDFNSLSPEEEELLIKMIKQKVNSPLTSSVGRLFDAVAALIGLRYEANFEGQAAIQLEQLIQQPFTLNDSEGYRFSINKDTKGVLQVSLKPCLQQILEDNKNHRSHSTISKTFHNTIINIVGEVCEFIRSEHNINVVTLSGGCFLNSYLLEGCIKHLMSLKFEVFYHKRFPTNDGSISLGQAAHGISLLGPS